MGGHGPSRGAPARHGPAAAGCAAAWRPVPVTTATGHLSTSLRAAPSPSKIGHAHTHLPSASAQADSFTLSRSSCESVTHALPPARRSLFFSSRIWRAEEGAAGGGFRIVGAASTVGTKMGQAAAGNGGAGTGRGHAAAPAGVRTAFCRGCVPMASLAVSCSVTVQLHHQFSVRGAHPKGTSSATPLPPLCRTSTIAASLSDISQR